MPEAFIHASNIPELDISLNFAENLNLYRV